MSESLTTALLVMIIGMITVFIILSLVVLSGNLLIKFVNAFIPADLSPAGKVTENHSQQSKTGTTNTSTLAAIITAVDVMTGGKGKADRIERID